MANEHEIENRCYVRCEEANTVTNLSLLLLLLDFFPLSLCAHTYTSISFIIPNYHVYTSKIAYNLLFIHSMYDDYDTEQYGVHSLQINSLKMYKSKENIHFLVTFSTIIANLHDHREPTRPHSPSKSSKSISFE